MDKWEADAASLAAIGAYLHDQDLQVRVRLPAELVRAAVVAWQRDDVKDSVVKHGFQREAATLALIGLEALDQDLPEFGEVELVLHPWRVGCALEVADAAGLLSPGSAPEG